MFISQATTQRIFQARKAFEQETINQNCLQRRAEKSRAEQSRAERRNQKSESAKLQTLLRGRETGHQLTLQNTIPTVYNLFINENITRTRQMYRGPWCYSWTDWIGWVMGMDGWGAVMVLISFAKTISAPANIKLQGPRDLFEVCSQTFLLHAMQ